MCVYVQKRYKYRNFFFPLFRFFFHAFSVYIMYLESYPAGSQWASFTFPPPPCPTPHSTIFLSFFRSFFFYYFLCRSMVFAKHKKPRRAKKRNDNRARAITRFTKRPFDSPLKGFYTRLLSSPFNRKTAVIIYGITARLWIFRVIK